MSIPPLELIIPSTSAFGAVEEKREVVLGLDVPGPLDQNALDHVAFDVHSENVLSGGRGFVGARGELDAARLAAAPDLYLGLDHDLAAEALAASARLVGSGGDPALGNRAPRTSAAAPCPDTRKDPLILRSMHGFRLVFRSDVGLHPLDDR